MHIALDASRTTAARRTGTEAYALHLLRHLLALDTSHSWQLYFRENPAKELFSLNEHVTAHIIYRPRLWTHLGLGPALRRAKVAGVFVPAHVLPVFSCTPAVMTVHDLGYLHFPQAHTRQQCLYLDWSTRYAVRHARHLLADSEATRADLIAHYQAPPAKITVVYPGIDAALAHVDDTAQRKAVLRNYGLTDQGYLLHVGTIQPRKNLIRLLEALVVLPAQRLVLAGQQGWLSAPIIERIHSLGLSNRVHLLGYVPDDHLPALYSAARALVLPSLYEGFGFPALEAMACGTPVVASRSGSLPEVCGEAALTFDATDTGALITQLRAITASAAAGADDTLRHTLIARGYQQARRFNWAKAAQETLRILEETFGHHE